MGNDKDPNELYSGTSWQLIGQDRCIQGAGNKFTALQEVEAGLPNITGTAVMAQNGTNPPPTGCIIKGRLDVPMAVNINAPKVNWFGGIDASLSSPIYGSSDTVQPPSIALFIWQRIA